jgi:hypothetical protein
MPAYLLPRRFGFRAAHQLNSSPSQTEIFVGRRSAMSELTQRRWAVISENGSEATDLNYDEAHALLHRLAGEGIHGLCIVTNEAARHFLREGSTAAQLKQPLPARN